MMKFVQFLSKRPSDTTIRSIRGVFALSLAGFLVYASPSFVLPFASMLGEPNATFAEYALAALVLIPGIFAVSGACVAKKKTVRLLQLSGSIFLFVLSATIVVPVSNESVESIPSPAVQSGSVNVSDLLTPVKKPEDPLNVSAWLNLFAFLALISGVTGKMVTEKCQKHGEIIKKIRV